MLQSLSSRPCVEAHAVNFNLISKKFQKSSLSQAPKGVLQTILPLCLAVNSILVSLLIVGVLSAVSIQPRKALVSRLVQCAGLYGSIILALPLSLMCEVRGAVSGVEGASVVKCAGDIGLRSNSGAENGLDATGETSSERLGVVDEVCEQAQRRSLQGTRRTRRTSDLVYLGVQLGDICGKHHLQAPPRGEVHGIATLVPGEVVRSPIDVCNFWMSRSGLYDLGRVIGGVGGDCLIAGIMSSTSLGGRSFSQQRSRTRLLVIWLQIFHVKIFEFQTILLTPLEDSETMWNSVGFEMLTWLSNIQCVIGIIGFAVTFTIHSIPKLLNYRVLEIRKVVFPLSGFVAKKQDYAERHSATKFIPSAVDLALRTFQIEYEQKPSIEEQKETSYMNAKFSE
ncbi:hypothetical protein Tco_0529000 [Tanacetum coccineum]